jgi:hypothetical protein
VEHRRYIYDPATNTWTFAANKLRSDQSSEEAWVKLPDNSILSYDVWSSISTGVAHSQRYVPSTNTWVDAGNLPDLLSSSAFGEELGPNFLLPDGRVFQLGANNHSALYTPSSNTWVAGPDMPTGMGADDAPGAELPNGHILFTADHPLFHSPTRMFDFDPGTNTLTDITSTLPNALQNVLNSNPSYPGRMLVLPSGQVLFAPNSFSANQLYVYTPDGSVNPASRPTITSVAGNGDGSFTLTGTQLNGISEGANYGDDAEMSSNYPIIRLVDNAGHVGYARTFNWSSTGVATGSTPETVEFTLPTGFTLANSTLYVVANGIASSTLPQGWSAIDVGNPGLPGNASFDGTTWTVQGSGSDIWSAPDQFQYAYTSISGDATLVARVTSLQNTGYWAKAGVMFRDGTASGAPYVAVVENPNLQVEMQWRDTAGADSNWNGAQVGDTVNPKWVRLVRSGNTFSAYYASTSGTPTSSDWVLIGSHTLAMAAPTAGLAVDANTNSALTTATFTNVSLTGKWVQTTAADFNSGTTSGTVLTNNSGGEVQLAAGSLNGTFTSAIFDASRLVTWGTASWTATVPAGSTLIVETRSGNTATPDGSWSAWAAVANGQAVASPGARSLQYRVTLTSNSTSVTPVLLDITFLWS